MLVQRGGDIDLDWLAGIRTLGLTAGASAPELLVREVVAALAQRYAIDEEQVETAQEKMIFKLPKALQAA
jgi:4-hydroxy-3-methylbut-2-en-1-yl diphosphate reductase